MNPNASQNEQPAGSLVDRWLPLWVFMVSGGALIATIIVFAIAAIPSRDPAPMPTTYYIGIWFMFTGLCALSVGAYIMRMKVLHGSFRFGAPHDAPLFDIFFAFAFAVLATLALVTVMSATAAPRSLLWLLLGFGAIGLLPLAAVRFRLIGKRG